MKDNIKNVFEGLLNKYTSEIPIIDSLWDEIESSYLGKKRYYHSLSHIADLLEELIIIKNRIEDWDTILFTLFYHDIIYDSLRKDNEEKSAQVALERMKSLNVPQENIRRCYDQIIATNTHQISDDIDTNYFTDADLSILGQEWERYQTYYTNVRKEYAIYPDVLYKTGRRKVLKHFLSMDYIFKTGYFRQQYESQAQKNLHKELSILS